MTFKDSQGNGLSNLGRVSVPEFDEIMEKVKLESDPKIRNDLIEKAFFVAHQDIMAIPLHAQVIPWAMNKKVEAPHRPDNRLQLDRVVVK